VELFALSGGGPHSQATIAKAIAVARENSLPFYFLYVVNLDFLAHATITRTHTIHQEMEQMGEFILLAAQSQAANQDVAAEGLVRDGTVSEEIATLCHEVEADFLVVGRPQLLDDEQNVFTHALLEQFTERVAAQTGATIIMPDEISP